MVEITGRVLRLWRSKSAILAGGRVARSVFEKLALGWERGLLCFRDLIAIDAVLISQ